MKGLDELAEKLGAVHAAAGELERATAPGNVAEHAPQLLEIVFRMNRAIAELLVELRVPGVDDNDPNPN